MKTRILYLDFIRALLCVIILLYHMGLLKGGYLAVCSFFALSGYLSAQTLRKVDFSALSYYKTRLFRIYIPLVVVVFVSLAICLLVLPEITWISMKREITSILFCYNNFWQTEANMDYFARHIDSPYMHLWYVAILLQLELIFPLIYVALEYIKRQFGKNIPLIMCCVIGLCSMGYFVYAYITGGVMASYYNTFVRCFSWFFGIAIGYWHVINRTFVIKRIEDKRYSKLILFILLLIQIILFVIVKAESNLYLVGMIGSTLIMCIMLDYVKSTNLTITEDKIPTAIKKVIGFVSNISYEIFLVQYPVIFIIDNVGIVAGRKYIIIVIITFAMAICVNIALHRQNSKLSMKIIRIALLVVLITGAGYGAYKYVIAPDLRAEQEQLEVEMRRLKQEQIRRHIEYEQERNYQSEMQDANEFVDSILANHNDIDSQIAAIDTEISKVNLMVVNLRITFVGDSVLLSASDVLYEYFNKCYIDAEIGRTAYAINPILQRLDNRGILGNVVVINCGANGDCPDYMKDEIMNTLQGKEVFWVTTSNNYSANISIINYAENYDNLHIIDWGTISEGHSEYFDGDGIHLAPAGKEAYSQAVLDAICDYYIGELEKEKRELEAQKN